MEARLAEIGVDEIYAQTFPVTQPRMTECELEVDGERHEVYAARPNVLQAVVTPEQGIEGETLYVGSGTLEDYGAISPEGRIVVLDFDNDGRWLDAFAFGAQAVIFIGDPDAVTRARHHVNLPANLPRFYVPAELAERLELAGPPRTVRLRAAVRWDKLHARNVIGVIRGTDPRFREGEEAREAIVLAAPLDSFSEVMGLAPGARDAANVAALLHMAEFLNENPPTRDVILAFFDAQTQNHLGARHFYGSLYRRMGGRNLADNSLEERRTHLNEEEKYIQEIQEALEQPDILDAPELDARVRREALRAFRGEVARLGGLVMDSLRPLRIQLRDRASLRNDIAAELAEAPFSLDVLEAKFAWRDAVAELRAHEPDSARREAFLREKLDELEEKIAEQEQEIESLETTDLAWNSLLRLVHENVSARDAERIEELSRRGIAHPGDPETESRRRGRFQRLVPEYYQLAKQGTREMLVTRLAELEQTRIDVQQALELDEAVGQSKNTVVLHVSLNMGDTQSRWCFVHGDDSAPLLNDDEEGIYAGIYQTIRRTVETLDAPLKNFDGRSVSGIYPSRLFAPARFVDSGSVPRMWGRFNLSIMTPMDPLRRQGLPSDRPEVLQLDRMFAQTEEAGRFLRLLSDHAGLSREFPIHYQVYYHEARWRRNQRDGCVVNQSDLGDPMRRAAVPNALVAAMPALSAGEVWEEAGWDRTPPGFLWHIQARSHSDGIFELPPITREREWLPFVATLDLEDEEVAGTAAARGLITGVTTQASFPRTLPTMRMVDIFRARSTTLAGYGFRRRVSSLAMRSTATAAFRSDRSLVAEYRNLLTVFAPADAAGLKVFNPYGLVLLNNEPTPEAYDGEGVPLDDPFRFLPMGERTARDLMHLNEYRLGLLRENQIAEESLEHLHGRAQDMLSDAQQASAESFGSWQGMTEASSAFSRRTYQPLVDVMEDLVTAVVFLLLLTIPFAYAMERLIIGTPHIQKRIGWFAVFFVATFVLMYAVNPAFQLAATPIIIFLAFTIILLSSLVIFIMLRKLDVEMKKMQGRRVAAHTVDVSRFSTMAAAVNMGISTMRRRPLRTILTSVTVILLTFTILTFASFTTTWGNRRGYAGPMIDTPDRIMVRDAFWHPISEDMFGVMRGYLGPRADTTPRYWVAPRPNEVALAAQDNQTLAKLVTDASVSNVVRVSAAMGIHRRDIEEQEQLRNGFEQDARLDLLESDGIFLSGAVARSLGLNEEDRGETVVLFKGEPFVFGGLLEQAFSRQTTLDGSSVMPVNHQASAAGEMEGEIAEAIADSDSVSFISFSMDATVVISADRARRLGGFISSVTLYPAEGETVEGLSEELAAITAMPVYAGTEEGVYRFFFTTLLEASGFRDLLIPVVLGGLIVFATMLGSVADREKEIYAFSSLGLAPAHVSMLFFAEAAIYAVVGGMGGYLIGQVAAQGLTVLGRWGNFAVPTMNFSSMNAVMTILIVMGIVLLSTIYPAVKAAGSANPGIQRTWKLPAPSGDILDIRFPFTVSEYDLTGVVNYLQEHFESFTDASIGNFATNSCYILRQQENDMLGFQASVALAPFDLGIEQDMTLLSQPSDVEGIDEVRILFRRRSGTYGDWQRANRVFVNELRKQFLIWRTIDEETSEEYREATLAGWNDFAVESRKAILASYQVQD